MKRKENEANMRSSAGRVPRTPLLFDGTISPMICPADGSTSGSHKKTRRKGRDKELLQQQTFQEQSYVVGGFLAHVLFLI